MRDAGRVRPLADRCQGWTALVHGDRAAAHHELGDDRREQAGDDEPGSAGHFGHEHNRGKRNAVAGAEERRHADDGEQRRVERVDRAADDTTDERAGHDERNEQATDAAAGDRGRRRDAAQDEDRRDQPGAARRVERPADGVVSGTGREVVAGQETRDDEASGEDRRPRAGTRTHGLTRAAIAWRRAARRRTTRAPTPATTPSTSARRGP